MILQDISMTGIPTFTYALATQNELAITLILCHFGSSIVINLPVCVYLIQHKEWLGESAKRGGKKQADSSEAQREDQQERQEEADERSQVYQRFGIFKTWLIDQHIDRILPCLVRQRNQDLDLGAPDPGGSTDRSYYTGDAVTDRSTQSHTNSYYQLDSAGLSSSPSRHQRDTRQDFYSKTHRSERFVTDGTESFMNEEAQHDRDGSDGYANPESSSRKTAVEMVDMSNVVNLDLVSELRLEKKESNDGLVNADDGDN